MYVVHAHNVFLTAEENGSGMKEEGERKRKRRSNHGAFTPKVMFTVEVVSWCTCNDLKISCKPSVPSAS